MSVPTPSRTARTRRSSSISAKPIANLGALLIDAPSSPRYARCLGWKEEQLADWTWSFFGAAEILCGMEPRIPKAAVDSSRRNSSSEPEPVITWMTIVAVPDGVTEELLDALQQTATTLGIQLETAVLGDGTSLDLEARGTGPRIQALERHLAILRGGDEPW